jgi:hypothetical protein
LSGGSRLDAIKSHVDAADDVYRGIVQYITQAELTDESDTAALQKLLVEGKKLQTDIEHNLEALKLCKNKYTNWLASI